MTNNDIKEQFLDMLEQHIGIIIKISGAYARDARYNPRIMEVI